MVRMAHPTTLQQVVQAVTGYWSWSQRHSGADPCDQKDLSPHAGGEFAYGLSRVNY
jgi:hypothetical protein